MQLNFSDYHKKIFANAGLFSLGFCSYMIGDEMHIVIDFQTVLGESGFRGIGRYSLSLARALACEGKKRSHRVTIVLNDMYPSLLSTVRDEFYGVVGQECISIFSTAGNTAEITQDNIWRTRASELLRERHIAALKPDVVFISSLFEGYIDNIVTSVKSDITLCAPTAVTLYDLIPLELPELYLQDSGYSAYYFNKLKSLKRSDILLSISSYSREEAIRLLDIDPLKIVNISAAVDSRFRPQHLPNDAAIALQQAYGIKRPFVFYVPGGFDPRKNFDRLLDAFAKLPANLRKQHQLVIGSKAPDGVADAILAKAESLGLCEDEVVLTGYLQDNDLLGLYSTCRLFVFPSLHEGFGLPVLEAMACGAPVIASDSTSLPEVVGRVDALFDPMSVAAMSQMMEKGLTDEVFRSSVATHGLRHAANFSWERSARLALDAFEDHFKFSSDVHLEAPTNNNSEDSFDSIMKSVYEMGLATQPTPSDLYRVRHALAVNEPRSVKNQLFVDISELVNRDAKSGIQRVVRSILLDLVSRPLQNYRVEPVYSEAGTNGFRYARKFTARFLGVSECVGEDAAITFAHGDVFIGLDLTAHLFPSINSMLSHMRSAGVKIHYVVYDLTPLNNPKWHTGEMTQAFLCWIDGLMKYSDSLVCISKSVADEVKAWLLRHPSSSGRRVPISYFHLGADIQNSQPTAGYPECASQIFETMFEQPVFLMVGTVEPRKGYAQVLDAFELLWREGCFVRLVIVGKSGWNVDALVERMRAHPERNARLFWLEGISDEYLQKIYATSTALLAASEAEGFGLPLIEAAQYGLPIIARELPVFKEVAGEHAYFFDCVDDEGLARVIKEWLVLKCENNEPSSAGMKWLTWAESCDELLMRTLPAEMWGRELSKS